METTTAARGKNRDPVPEIQLLTVREVATMLSISLRSVWRAVAAGDLPKPIRIRGSARWLLSEIKTTIEQAASRRR